MDELQPHGVSNDKSDHGYEVITKEYGRVTNMRLFIDRREADRYYTEERRRLGLEWTLPPAKMAPSGIPHISILPANLGAAALREPLIMGDRRSDRRYVASPQSLTRHSAWRGTPIPKFGKMLTAAAVAVGFFFCAAYALDHKHHSLQQVASHIS